MSQATHITVRVPMTIRRRPGRKTVVTPVLPGGMPPITTRADPALVKALARAFRYQRLLDDGRYTSITEMANAEKIDRGYLGRILRLALLAPDVVETLLNGCCLENIDQELLMKPFPACWAEQRTRYLPFAVATKKY